MINSCLILRFFMKMTHFMDQLKTNKIKFVKCNYVHTLKFTYQKIK